MRRLAIIALLVCVAVDCFGQAFVAHRRKAFVAAPAEDGAWYPTNLSGVVGWYVAEDYTTGGGGPSWPSRWTTGRTFTNTSASGTWPVLNSSDALAQNKATINFDGSDDHLKITLFTNEQPVQVTLAINYTNNASTAVFVSDPNNAVNTPRRDGNTISFTGAAAASSTVTNRFVVLTFLFNGTSSTVYTNNISGALVSCGSTNKMTGFGLMRNVVFNNSPNKGSIAECVIYSGRTPITNSTESALLYSYLTNKYAINP